MPGGNDCIHTGHARTARNLTAEANVPCLCQAHDRVKTPSAAGAAGQLPDVRTGLLNGVRGAGQPDAMSAHLQLA